MEQKNIIIICATFVIIVAIICGAFYFTSIKDTSLSISDTKVTQGDKVTITLVDENGNPLANKKLTINVTSAKNQTRSFNVTTNDKGKFKFKVKNSKGKYRLIIKYDGDILLSPCNLTKILVVKENEVQTTSSSSSSKPSNNGKHNKYGDTDYNNNGVVDSEEGKWGYDEYGNPIGPRFYPDTQIPDGNGYTYHDVYGNTYGY